MKGEIAERRQIQVSRMRRRSRSRRTLWMRTMRPSVLQRSHGPNEAENERQKENKKQIATKCPESSFFSFPYFLKILVPEK